MLRIVVPSAEMFDEKTNEFITVKACELQLEHSLVSISKWEAKFNKAFLSKLKKTNEETLYYIRCMTLTQNVNPMVYNNLTSGNISEITEYTNAPMTAVHFPEKENGSVSGKSITSDLIYSWMIALNIPFECQKWHLNRLLTLIRVCNINNNPKKGKHSTKDILSRNAALNAARRKQFNTNG